MITRRETLNASPLRLPDCNDRADATMLAGPHDLCLGQLMRDNGDNGDHGDNGENGDNGDSGTHRHGKRDPS